MDRKIAIILLLAVFSECTTLIGLYLILSLPSTPTAGQEQISLGAMVIHERPNFMIPLSAGLIGWVLTIYEVITLNSGKISGTLRKMISDEGFDRSVYRLLSGRGGARRLAIMEALRIPRLRNEIANITSTDWKEVDRNIRILESENLVSVKFSHGTMSVYSLTESGKELVDIIKSQRERKSPEAVASRS